MAPSTPSSPARDALRVEVCGQTDVGRARSHNEDTYSVIDLTTGEALGEVSASPTAVGPHGLLLMVADGMGGASAGEVASALAVETIHDALRMSWCASPAGTRDRLALALREATELANTRIFDFGEAHPEHRGMGTTATLAAILGRTLTLCQVGDSRAYIIRDRQALQVTKDQSLMQKLIDAGEITPEAAEVSARRNIILQALGPEPSVSVDVSVQQLEPGDVVLLCSDGLTGQLRNQEIADIVTAEREVSRICSRLIERANETGGPDNITVVVARVEGDARTGGALPARGGHIAPMLSALLGGIAGLAALVALVLWWRV